MPKHLKAIIKECRHLLEQDLSSQLHSETGVQETALAFLMELSILRCFEEQLWNISSQRLFFSDDNGIRNILASSRKILQSEICFPLNFCELAGITPSIAALKAVIYHLSATISSEEWRFENILGWIYQYFYDDTPEQKRDGRFYTPEPIAEYIVSQVFDTFWDSQEDGRQFSCSLLDLGCGSGVFALWAFDRLYELYKDEHHLPGGVHLNSPDGHHLPGGVHLSNPKDGRHSGSGAHRNIPQQILENHLFLVDNDVWACQIAAINLYLKAKSVDPNCHIRKMNIFCADALRRWENLSPSPNNINKLFTRKYDLVVGNPPYIVVNQLQAPKELIRLYKSYRSAAFKINTFALFIERGIELLKSNGLLGMIVPNTLLTQVYFEPLRKYILNTSKILRILDTKRMFDNAFVENCILLLQRESEAFERTKNAAECVVSTSNGDRKNFQFMPAAPGSLQSTAQIPQHHFEKAPFNMFNVRIDEQVFVLMEKIANGNPTLGEICESHDGVNPGNAKHKLIVAEKLDETCKKVLNGKNIGRYWLKWGGLYVRYNRNLLTKSDNVRWGHQPSLDSAKILTRQTADRIIGTLDNGEYYTTNSIHTTILKDGANGFDLKYLLALLNSKLISFYYRKLFPEDGQVFSQVKLINLRQLPLKPISPEDQNYFIAQVDALLQERKAVEEIGNNKGHDTPEYLADVEMMLCHLRERDEMLDQKVYELYQLSPDEIQTIECELRKEDRNFREKDLKKILSA